MPHNFEDHRFNDDLLLDEQDQATARDAFPGCADVLKHQELQVFFKRFDEPANYAKTRSRCAGFAAVILAVLALFGASAAPLYKHLPKDLAFAKAIEVASAILGAVSVVVGLGGVMYWRSKKEWLYKRLLTERIRQFHFQTFVCRVDDVAESIKGDTKSFLAKRQHWFSAFKLRFEKKAAAEFGNVLQSEESSGAWLHPAPRELDRDLLDALPEAFFESYRELRIRHQLQYADWKLRKEQGLFSALGLRRQEEILASGSLIATLALFIIELSVVIALLAVWKEYPKDWAHVAAVWCAIVALALRTLEEGLQPKREIERYWRYRVAIQDILRRFDDAQSRAAKLNAMVEMERLSFQEMCDFLRSNYEARFVM